jgi:hypothetical protein
MTFWKMVAVAAALALAACGQSAVSGPEATVETLYAPYVASNDTPPPDLASLPLTAELKAVIDKAGVYSEMLNEPVIDYDPIVGAQDWQISDVSVAREGAPREDGADVVATFKNGGEPKRVLFLMRRVDGDWRIDDIGEGADSLRAIVSAALQPIGEPSAMEAPVRAVYEQVALAGARSPALHRWAPLTADLKRRLATGTARLDLDPVVDGRDYTLGPVAYEAASSAVIARFDAEGQPKIVVYDLAQDGAAWKIANIRSPGAWDLDQKLREAGVE